MRGPAVAAATPNLATLLSRSYVHDPIDRHHGCVWLCCCAAVGFRPLELLNHLHLNLCVGHIGRAPRELLPVVQAQNSVQHKAALAGCAGWVLQLLVRLVCWGGCGTARLLLQEAVLGACVQQALL